MKLLKWLWLDQNQMFILVIFIFKILEDDFFFFMD